MSRNHRQVCSSRAQTTIVLSWMDADSQGRPRVLRWYRSDPETLTLDPGDIVFFDAIGPAGVPPVSHTWAGAIRP
jgi:hypothetical protein